MTIPKDELRLYAILGIAALLSEIPLQFGLVCLIPLIMITACLLALKVIPKK